MATGEQVDFIGRAAEIEAVLASLAEHPLTLVLGPGGAGKTKLARVVLSQPEHQGAVFCDLSSAKSFDDVVAALGSALGLTFETRDATVGQLRHALEARGGLVVLDNLESIAEGADVLLELLDAGPRFLGTSRAIGPFGAAHVVELGPLPREDAMRLFIERARRVLPSFRPDEATRALVDRLDGSPLAIELAAARVRVLSPGALLERFGQHLDLVRGDQDRPERHRSLRAIVEGSWSLCTADERIGLAAASLFRGSFDLAAAEALLGDGAADTLDRLLDSSLLSVTDSATLGARFRLSESVQTFAAERLNEQSALRAQLERRFADHYRDVALRGTEAATTVDRVALATLSADADNLLSAFLLDGRSALAFDLAFQRRTPAVGQLAALEMARARLSTHSPEEQAELQIAIAQAQRRTGDAHETLKQARIGVELAAATGGRDLLARALLLEAAALYDGGKLADASVLTERASTLAEACEAYAVAARASSLRAFSAMESGDLRAADQHGERAMKLAREHGFALVEFNVENLFGAVEARRGRLTNAEDHLRRALALIAGLGLGQQEALAWGNLGRVLVLAGRHDAAREALSRSLGLSQRMGLRRVEVLHHVNLGKLEADAGNLAAARACALQADALLMRIGSRLTSPVATLLAAVALLEGRFEDAAETVERALAQPERIERASARATLHAAHAAALASNGRLVEAEGALAKTRELAASDATPELGIVAAHTATVALARAAIALAGGDTRAAGLAYREGLAALELSEPWAATSVDVRLARRCALVKLDALPGPLKAATRDMPTSARVSFELVSRAGRTIADALPADADLAFDALERHAVIDGTTRIDLRKKPLAARLLEVMLSNPNKRHEKSDLYRDVWQAEFRSASQTAALYKAVDRLVQLLDPDPRRFLRWDEGGALVLVAKQPALLRDPDGVGARVGG